MQSNFHTGMQTCLRIRHRLQNYNKFTVSVNLSIKMHAFKTGTRPRTLRKTTVTNVRNICSHSPHFVLSNASEVTWNSSYCGLLDLTPCGMGSGYRRFGEHISYIPWRWRKYVPLKPRSTTRLHGVIIQKIINMRKICLVCFQQSTILHTTLQKLCSR
jgi:hypothetical protein